MYLNEYVLVIIDPLFWLTVTLDVFKYDNGVERIHTVYD